MGSPLSLQDPSHMMSPPPGLSLQIPGTSQQIPKGAGGRPVCFTAHAHFNSSTIGSSHPVPNTDCLLRICGDRPVLFSSSFPRLRVWTPPHTVTAIENPHPKTKPHQSLSTHVILPQQHTFTDTAGRCDTRLPIYS